MKKKCRNGSFNEVIHVVVASSVFPTVEKNEKIEKNEWNQEKKDPLPVSLSLLYLPYHPPKWNLTQGS